MASRSNLARVGAVFLGVSAVLLFVAGPATAATPQADRIGDGTKWLTAPFTGIHVLPPVVLSVVLIVAGGGFLLLQRRRKGA